MSNPHASDLMIDPEVEALIRGKLHGLDDFEKLRCLSELIDLFSREVPAMLAEQRINHLRRLTEVYNSDEIKAGTGLSANRIRKLLDR